MNLFAAMDGVGVWRSARNPVVEPGLHQSLRRRAQPDDQQRRRRHLRQQTSAGGRMRKLRTQRPTASGHLPVASHGRASQNHPLQEPRGGHHGQPARGGGHFPGKSGHFQQLQSGGPDRVDALLSESIALFESGGLRQPLVGLRWEAIGVAAPLQRRIRGRGHPVVHSHRHPRCQESHQRSSRVWRNICQQPYRSAISDGNGGPSQRPRTAARSRHRHRLGRRRQGPGNFSSIKFLSFLFIFCFIFLNNWTRIATVN